VKRKKSLTKLECFVYVLIRDYLPGGRLEEALEKSKNLSGEPMFSDGWMVSVAERMARELIDQSKGS
jgi:hypothetical protein